MGRRSLAGLSVAGLLLAGCSGGGGGDGDSPPTSASGGAADVTACAERLTFAETSWEAVPSPGVPPGNVLWQARFTFSNPNPVEVRLSDSIVVLELDSSDGHSAGVGRTAFSDQGAAAVGPRATLERVASAWMRDSKIPKTRQVYVATQATIDGRTCTVPVDRVSTTPPSPQVFTLSDCGSESC